MEAELFKKKFGGQAPKQSAILRKKLQGQAKYFDSGDYNMAKSGMKQKKDVVVGKAIPTVDQLPQRKQSCSRLSSLVDGEPSSPTQPEQQPQIEEQTEEQKSKLQVVESEG
jgi:hypothetical protein